MTAFTASAIPASVNTIEELFVWCASILTEINPTIQIQATSGTVEPVVQMETFRFASQDVDPQRAVVVGYIPLQPNWRGQGKIWSNGVKELSTNPIPAGYSVA
jgi:hypothetical protein